MNANYKSEKGMVLPIVVIVFSIILILGFSLTNTTINETRTNIVDEESKKALQYAEAGYNRYLWYLNDDVNFYNLESNNDLLNDEGKEEIKEFIEKIENEEPIKFEDGYYKLKVEKPTDTKRYVKLTSTGWTYNNPNIKRTVVVKLRKRQFVHHVYVSNNDGGNIWWVSDEEIHGPYHTNGVFRVKGKPKFYNTVTYSNDIEEDVKKSDREDVYLGGEPKKVPELELPKNNEELRKWAEMDNMVFAGRTCIYLDRDKLKIRNGNAHEITTYDIPKNGVIYVEGTRRDKGYNKFHEKFNLNDANVFVSGSLKGRLTIAAENNIYITSTDPTNWNKPKLLSTLNSGGIEYSGTKFNGKGEKEMSVWDSEKGIYTRYALAKDNGDGQDMLGLVANHDVMIMHYGWFKNKEENPYGKPYWCNEESVLPWNRKKPYKCDVASKNININAAIFALNGGFGYENFNKGLNKGDITFWGNITQNKRKPVGVEHGIWFDIFSLFDTGYNKKYAHDPRMFYDYPPHILEPENVGWEVIEWRETNEHVEEKTEGVD